MLFALVRDFLLKLGLMLVNVSVVKQFVFDLHFDGEEPWLSSLAFHVLQDFVVIRAFFFVFCKDSVHSVDGRVSYKLLEVWMTDETPNVIMEDDIEGSAKNSFFVLIMPSFANSIR